MNRTGPAFRAVLVALAGCAGSWLAPPAAAQDNPAAPQAASPQAAPEEVQPGAGTGALPSVPGPQGTTTGLSALSGSNQSMLQVPVSTLFPGNIQNRPDIRNPAGDQASLQRGMQFFSAFNCIGCHADNGGGGMGPSLSDWRYIYGADPANVFLTIKQGRPNGMPAWGGALPDSAIWDLVTYVLNLREPAPKTFGKTISREPLSPDKEQVPTEFVNGPGPWQHTESFSSGQKPNAR